MKYNHKYWYLHLFGILGSTYIGAVFPIFAYLLSQIIDVLSTIESTPKDDIVSLTLQQKLAMDLSLGMLAISFGALFIAVLRGVSFTYLTEKLGFFLKKNSFEKSINKNMS